MKPLEGKRVLITGGTGSLGRILVRRIMMGADGMGEPSRITVFSRDEAKQHDMRLALLPHQPSSESARFRDFERKVQFVIGDVRNPDSIASALTQADVVVSAAALKQVPSCEYFPHEAVMTNILGAVNIVQAIERLRLPVETVVGISTDKACKPVNVMGMTKALQERVYAQANIRKPDTRFVCVRYGNVLASRGSVVPLFRDQIRRGGPVTITSEGMTRFLISLDQAVDTVFAAIRTALPGETYVPQAPSGRVIDVAQALIGDRDVEVRLVGIRPGEKLHEILISEEETSRTVSRDGWYAIAPILPELRRDLLEGTLAHEYSSADGLMSVEEIRSLLAANRLTLDQESVPEWESLRSFSMVEKT
jgi:FlaA1/EpsC-like NDP-sugar epimerase